MSQFNMYCLLCNSANWLRGVRKMKLKSGHITSVQCISFTTEWGNLCQTSQGARKIGALPACQRNAIEWRFAGGPIVARDWILAGFTLGSYIK